MKIRLEGTKEEINWLIESLSKVYSVNSKSKLYANRNNQEFRCYLEIVSYKVGSDSAIDSKAIPSNNEPQPKPWDAILGGQNDQY